MFFLPLCLSSFIISPSWLVKLQLRSSAALPALPLGPCLFLKDSHGVEANLGCTTVVPIQPRVFLGADHVTPCSWVLYYPLTVGLATCGHFEALQNPGGSTRLKSMGRGRELRLWEEMEETLQ